VAITKYLKFKTNLFWVIPILKQLPKSNLANLTMANAKSMGNVDFHYESFFTSAMTVSTVDECMDCLISFASRPQGATVKELSSFIRNESGRTMWAQIAVGHFSQVISFDSCRRPKLIITQMAYELDVCSSSCGVFSTIWGFHRIGLLVYPPTGGDNTLFVSENLSAGKDRKDPDSTQAILEGLFFMTVSSILLTYGERIVPPNLRNETFLSWFRG
jgi:hypothetical protein